VATAMMGEVSGAVRFGVAVFVDVVVADVVVVVGGATGLAAEQVR
jgi:tetrahydromethanopterin S-methyltransferase subunit E